MTSFEHVGFIGGGRVTRIFLDGWKRADALPQNVTVSDPAESARAAIAERFPGVRTVESNAEAAAADLVFLAVHPPVAAGTLQEIRSALKPETVLVSLVPKVTAARISDLLGGFERIVRMIPNAPSVVGAGYNPICFGPGVSSAERTALFELFAPLGRCPEVAEETLEVYAVVSAMGPTYFWYQFLLLEQLAEEFGLTRGAAKEAVAAMLDGAVRTLAESGLAPEQVLDLIPVKPLADLEPVVTEAMRGKLTALMAKLRP